MKSLFAATLGALLLSTSAMAAPANTAADPAPQGGVVVSAPETLGNYGSQALPVFNYSDPGSDPVTISTPNSFGNGASQQTPIFNYQGAVPVYGTPGSVARPDSVLFPSTVGLMNQTGGEH
ncbi:MAG: hypothetical protein ACREFU_16395 [Acetobacteraceae bacterium]